MDSEKEETAEFFTLSKSDLLDRGWTEKMIQDFLGGPDRSGFNVHSTGRDMLLYDYERVIRVEDSDEWEEMFLGLFRRRLAKATNSLREMMTKWSMAAAKQAMAYSVRRLRIEDFHEYDKRAAAVEEAGSLLSYNIPGPDDDF